LIGRYRKCRAARGIAPLFLLVLLTGCEENGTVRVVRVVDGDTIVIESGERVRYIGIDTPELMREGREAEPLAEEARALNSRLVEGKWVRLEFDQEHRDRFGRILAYVWMEEVMVNEELLRAGLARSKDYPPNLRHQAKFDQIEAEAKRKRFGLWGVPP
jgi:micrococcal nuclease